MRAMKLIELVKRFDILFFKRRMLFQKAASDAGLYFGQLPIMEYVIKHNNCSQVEIADTLHLSAASVAISTKRLQKAGMLDKAVDETNLRSKKLTVTDKGREMAENCRKLFNSLDERLFAGFDEKELVQLRDYLDRLIANISEEQSIGSNINFYEIVAMKNQLHSKFCCEEGEDIEC